MPLRPRTTVAVVLCLSLVAPLPAAMAPSEARGAAKLQPTTVALAAPPVRVHVPEPPHARASMPPASAMRPKVVPAVRPPTGVHVAGPPMALPTEIDAVIKAAARRRALVPAEITVKPAGSVRRAAPGAAAQPGTRRAQSLPGDSTASGTGINPWWRYQEQGVPGGGRLMVNVGTGNLLLQDDDMVVPHKGIAMAFRRTYNSQSAASVPHQFGSWTSLYGNGWTNTFDAHFLSMSSTLKTIYDIDGARYDYYSPPGNPAGTPLTPLTPGQHATLVFDGSCGWLWTKKSGTSYYFYGGNPTLWCPWLGSVGGYAGRLYQIIGRNRNTYLTFNYTWDNGDASSTGKINTISVQAESGMSTTLTFANVGPSNLRLLQKITFPDDRPGQPGTTVQYAYDANGNLTSVSHPPNNTAGTRPTQGFGYQALGTGYVMWYATTPRWTGSDGGYIALAFAGADVPSSTLSGLAHVGVMNPAVPDGVSSGGLQSGYTTGPMVYLYEWYQTGVTTPTYRDSDGHYTNWVVDGLGRPTQTQECTATTGIWTCTGTMLATNESWDANSNLVAELDPRGNETDYAYDGNGNPIAVAGPPFATSQGTFRRTKLYSYDSNNNVTAYCDPVATHSSVPGGDWTVRPTPPPAGQGLCPQSPYASRFQWATTTIEPFGELASSTTPATAAAPNGYTNTYSYQPSSQGGADYGLVTSVVGDPIVQNPAGQAPANLSPSQTFQYDLNGNEICYFNGTGSWLSQYDNLNRQVALADPDDNAIPGCGKTSSSYQTAKYTHYFPDGQVQYTETSAQHAADVAAGSTDAAVSFTYDLDGDKITEAHHHGCVTITNCSAGVTTSWYDGADRLVETMQPYDATVDYHPYKWLTQHLYDLSAGGTQTLTIPASSITTATSTAPFRAYGNLYDTRSYADLGFSANDSAPQWVDHLGTAYDALDRTTASYDLAVGVTPQHQRLYDQTQTTWGRQSSDTKATGESITTDYDAEGNLASTTIAYPGGAPPSPSSAVAPSRTYTYDSGARVASITSALGTQSYAYDAVGHVLAATEPVGQGGNTISYGYAANGWRTALSVSGALNQQLFTYSYRADGLPAQQQVNNGGWKSFVWTYSTGGRLLQRTDPANGNAVNEDPRTSPRGGFASTFHPLTNAYDAFGNRAAVTYSNGYTVNGISTDLEGNQSSELDSTTYNAASVQYIGSHVSAPRKFSNRDEVAFEGPTSTNVSSTTINEYASGIQLPGMTGAYSGGPPARNTVFGFPLGQIGSSPNLPLNPLDGFEISSAGQYANGNDPTNYTSNITYDASGRFVSSDLQQCTPSYQFNTAAGSEDKKRFTYDAEDHTTSEFIGGLGVQTSSGTACSFGPLASYWTYVISWGTGGHPFKLGVTSGNSSTFNEYMHWDGDSLLFTTSSPSAGVDDVKIGAFAEVTTADGNMAVYDRDASGVILDAHTTSWSTSNISYNDTFGDPSRVVLAECNAYGAGPPCIVISEPKPENISGYAGFNVQGVRGVDTSLGHWTTPDALANATADPASQLPYMYDRNNPYRYQDPSGYEGRDCRDHPLTPLVNCAALPKPTMSPKEAAELLQRFNLDPLDGKQFLPNTLLLLGALTPFKMGGGGAEATVTLFRAVGPGELEDIAATGTYRLGRGNEIKYLTPSLEAAQHYAAFFAKDGESYTITSAVFHVDRLPPLLQDLGVPGKGQYILDASHFPHGPVTIHK